MTPDQVKSLFLLLRKVAWMFVQWVEREFNLHTK